MQLHVTDQICTLGISGSCFQNPSTEALNSKENDRIEVSPNLITRSLPCPIKEGWQLGRPKFSLVHIPPDICDRFQRAICKARNEPRR